jgi:hypothetical protein
MIPVAYCVPHLHAKTHCTINTHTCASMCIHEPSFWESLSRSRTYHACMYTCTYMYTHTHTCIHVYIHTAHASTSSSDEPEQRGVKRLALKLNHAYMYTHTAHASTSSSDEPEQRGAKRLALEGGVPSPRTTVSTYTPAGKQVCTITHIQTYARKLAAM